MALNGNTWTDWITFNGEPDTFIEARFDLLADDELFFIYEMFDADKVRVIPDSETLDLVHERIQNELERERRENEISSHDKDPETGRYY